MQVARCAGDAEHVAQGESTSGSSLTDVVSVRLSCDLALLQTLRIFMPWLPATEVLSLMHEIGCRSRMQGVPGQRYSFAASHR